jgi:hypothetical protein
LCQITPDEQNLFAQKFGFTPATVLEVHTFSRLRKENEIYHSKAFSRVQNRNNYTITPFPMLMQIRFVMDKSNYSRNTNQYAYVLKLNAFVSLLMSRSFLFFRKSSLIIFKMTLRMHPFQPLSL